MLAGRARYGVYVRRDRGDGRTVLAMAGGWQGSLWVNSDSSADRGDSDRMCATSQKLLSGVV